ncbi:HupE/UreJ family protein [Zwartia vadi]|uniref:HupE/UreJ family protein n=1 Tax=Zwartia vadi TaxID=3058168 RepID=UPI0025B40E02|nr:HupE/UreJ family protein [Zwartia vadi]MDN3988877.1 HupE/UreJ family protein [Zwartia vadi]
MRYISPQRLGVLLLALLPLIAFAHGISDEDKQRMLDGGYIQYIMLGASHMLTGYDHLLFLLGVVFFLTNFKDIVKFVTVFTIGHCITLIFATYFKITWNFWLVDAIIAVSVIYKGFDNNGGFQRHFNMSSPNLIKMVFAFGLLHGFGLSTRLQQLPLGDDPVHMILRILSFNLGVELGQILALAVMVAVLSFWRKTSHFGKFSYVANLGLILAGIYLLFAQLHGYQHDVNGESFRFPTEEHRHVHEDLDIQNTTDNSRNAL